MFNSLMLAVEASLHKWPPGGMCASPNAGQLADLGCKLRAPSSPALLPPRGRREEREHSRSDRRSARSSRSSIFESCASAATTSWLARHVLLPSPARAGEGLGMRARVPPALPALTDRLGLGSKSRRHAQLVRACREVVVRTPIKTPALARAACARR